MPEGLRARAFARAERKFDVMQELGCDLLMICSNVSPDSLGGIDRAAVDLPDPSIASREHPATAPLLLPHEEEPERCAMPHRSGPTVHEGTVPGVARRVP